MAGFLYILFTTVIILCYSLLVSATVDMNIRELQFVADHLTEQECRKLEAALEQKRFQIDWKQLDKRTKKLTQINKSAPCLVRLLHWDRDIAKKNTFHDLAIRLKELGFIELSDKLSKNVYHEKAHAVDKQFIKDPFKKLIPTKSTILEEPKDRRTSELEPAPADDRSHANVVLWVTLGGLTSTIAILVGFYVCCPQAFCLIWRKGAPEGCVVGFDVCIHEYSYCCKRFCKHSDRHLLGKRSFKKQKQRRPSKTNTGVMPEIVDFEAALNKINSLTKAI